MSNKLRGGPNDVHGLLIDQAADAFRQGSFQGCRMQDDPPGVRLAESASAPAVYTSRVIEPPFAFNELIPSYNVDVPEGSGFAVEVRVGREDEGIWSPFYYMVGWGKAPVVEPKTLESPHGSVNVDYFQSAQLFDRVQYRVRLSPSPQGRSPVIRLFALAYSRTVDGADSARTTRASVDPGPPSGWARRLPVPWRSQMVEDPDLSWRVCSPTCVAMVMAYRGVDRPTAEVARVLWDEDNEIYGNWARAVQGAYTFGMPGYLERFGDWDGVKRCIARGQPVIASIRIDKGQFSNEPERFSTGHLLVITGFDGNGNVHVNDPGVSSMQRGITRHPLEDMAQVWLANGGVGYILLSSREK